MIKMIISRKSRLLLLLSISRSTLLSFLLLGVEVFCFVIFVFLSKQIFSVTGYHFPSTLSFLFLSSLYVCRSLRSFFGFGRSDHYYSSGNSSSSNSSNSSLSSLTSYLSFPLLLLCNSLHPFPLIISISSCFASSFQAISYTSLSSYACSLYASSAFIHYINFGSIKRPILCGLIIVIVVGGSSTTSFFIFNSSFSSSSVYPNETNNQILKLSNHHPWWLGAGWLGWTVVTFVLMTLQSRVKRSGKIVEPTFSSFSSNLGESKIMEENEESHESSGGGLEFGVIFCSFILCLLIDEYRPWIDRNVWDYRPSVGMLFLLVGSIGAFVVDDFIVELMIRRKFPAGGRLCCLAFREGELPFCLLFCGSLKFILLSIADVWRRCCTHFSSSSVSVSVFSATFASTSPSSNPNSIFFISFSTLLTLLAIGLAFFLISIGTESSRDPSAPPPPSFEDPYLLIMRRGALPLHRSSGWGGRQFLPTYNVVLNNTGHINLQPKTVDRITYVAVFCLVVWGIWIRTSSVCTIPSLSRQNGSSDVFLSSSHPLLLDACASQRDSRGRLYVAEMLDEKSNTGKRRLTIREELIDVNGEEKEEVKMTEAVTENEGKKEVLIVKRQDSLDEVKEQSLGKYADMAEKDNALLSDGRERREMKSKDDRERVEEEVKGSEGNVVENSSKVGESFEMFPSSPLKSNEMQSERRVGEEKEKKKNGEMSVVVITSSTRKEFDWIYVHLPDISSRFLFVYTPNDHLYPKSNSSSSSTFLPLDSSDQQKRPILSAPEVGATFTPLLQFIAERYECLQEWVVFLNSHRISKEGIDLAPLINDLSWLESSKTNKSSPAPLVWYFGNRRNLHSYAYKWLWNISPEILHDWSNIFPKEDLPPSTFDVMWNAQFAINRRIFYRRPKEFWMNLFHFITSASPLDETTMKEKSSEKRKSSLERRAVILEIFWISMLNIEKEEMQFVEDINVPSR